MAHLYTSLGLNKGQPPAPSGPGLCCVRTKSSWPLQRHCIGPKGHQRQALTPSPFGGPLVATGWSPWCPVLLILPGQVLTWCLRVWQSSFFPRPSPSRRAPSSSSGCPLSPLLWHHRLPHVTEWLLLVSRPARFRLEVCRPVRARTFQSFPAAQASSSMWSWDPSRAQQRGKDTLQRALPDLCPSVHTAFLTSSPLLPQDQAHVGSKLSPSHGPSRGTVLDRRDLRLLQEDLGLNISLMISQAWVIKENRGKKIQERVSIGTSLAVQWLRLSTSNTRGTGFSPA